MKRLGHQLLAGAALAAYEHRDIAFGGLLRQRVYPLHSGAGAHHAGKRVGRLQLGAQTQHLGLHLLGLDLLGHVPVDDEAADRLSAAVAHRRGGAVEQPLLRHLPGAGRLHHVAAVEEKPSLQLAQVGFPEPLFQACLQIARRRFLELALLQTHQLLVDLVGEDQASADVVHRNGVSRGIQHGFQSSMTDGELSPFLRQIPLDVPLPHQGKGDLLYLLVHERFPDIEQLVQQLHVVDDLGQRPVGVRRHDDDLDVAIDLSHPADRLDAVDARRHSDIDVGHGHGAVRFPSRPDDFVRFLPVARVQQLELREKALLLFLAHERGCQIVGRRPDKNGLQHLREVVVDLVLVVDDQHAVVLMIHVFIHVFHF